MKWFKRWSRQKSVSQRNNNKSNQLKKSLSDVFIIDKNDKNCDKIIDKTVNSVRCKSYENISCSSSSVNNNNNNLKKDKNGGVRSDDLTKQVKNLENLISDPSEENSLFENRLLVDPDDFFEDPDSVSVYKEKKAEIKFYDEWIVIDDLPNSSIIDDEFDSSFEEIKKVPSVISLNSYTDDEFGLFFTNSVNTPEASYYKILDDNIQLGTKITKLNLIQFSDNIHEEHDCYYAEEENKRKAEEKLKLISPSKEKYENEAFDKSLMGPILKRDRSLSVQKREKKIEGLSIQKYFGLSDSGSIIIHFDHIRVEKGCTLISKKKKRCSVTKGCEISEDFRCNHNLRYLLTCLWSSLKGNFFFLYLFFIVYCLNLWAYFLEC